MASIPHGMIAADQRLSGKSIVSSQAFSVTTPSLRSVSASQPVRLMQAAPISVAGIGLMGFGAVLWLVMAVIAVVMLVAMLLVEAGGFLLRGGRPAPSGQRRTGLTPSIF